MVSHRYCEAKVSLILSVVFRESFDCYNFDRLNFIDDLVGMRRVRKIIAFWILTIQAVCFLFPFNDSFNI